MRFARHGVSDHEKTLMKRALAIPLAISLLTAGALAADNWPQFRGANAGVIADDPTLPDTWSESENVLWKIDVPGFGWSSPIVWGDHVFVTSALGADTTAPPKGLPLASPADAKSTSTVHQWVVYDFDVATGKLRWKQELHSAAPPASKHIRNSFSSETPVTDGERVYVYWGTIGRLVALDMNGKTSWTTDVGTFRSSQGWGTAASPLLYKGRVYIVNDNREQSFIAAYDARDGRQIWKTVRDDTESYSTPMVWENGLRTEIVTQGRNKFRSYSLEGQLLWEMRATSTSPVGTPVAKDDLLYISSGFHQNAFRPVYAIRPGAVGDITLKSGESTNTHVAWSQPTLASYQTSGLIYAGCLYTLIDNSFLLCHDPKTGKEIYGKQRISGESSGFAASPWAYNGKLFALSEDGDTFVVQAGPEFKVLGRNALNEMALATPAIARSSVFIRTQSKLYRIGKKR